MRKTYRFQFNKLVRDNVPNVMSASGIKVFERVIDKDEYLKQLKHKLIEEANEVVLSMSAQEICEEMADVLEVIHSLLRSYDLTFSDVQNIADKKRAEKGGFHGKYTLNLLSLMLAILLCRILNPSRISIPSYHKRFLCKWGVQFYVCHKE